MSPRALMCAFSERVDTAVSSPWSWLVYIVVRIAAQQVLSSNLIMLLISDLGIVLLLLMSTAQARRSAKQERQLDELARVNPEIDDRAIEAEAA